MWDFDGTLAHRPGGWTEVLLSLLKRHAPQQLVTADQVRPYLRSGFPWHEPENAHPGRSDLEWWEELEPVFSRAIRAVGVESRLALSLAGQVRAAYIDHAHWQRFPDTLPALEMLTLAGWKHVLLSNHVPELSVLMERLGLASYFRAVFNSAETGYEKPHPRAFRAVLDWVEPGAKAWMIGDSYSVDILGARKIGLPAVLVRKPHPDADVCCISLVEILTCLNKII